MKRIIGGERLGSGKGMSVNMHAYSRSNHDLSHTIRTSMNCGTLVPVLKMFGLPGDTIDIKTSELVRTVPTNNALFGRFKYRIDTFVVPLRLTVGALHNNMLGVGQNIGKVILPQIRLTAAPNTKLIGDATFDVDTQQIAPDSLNRYLGIAGVGYNTTNQPIAENKLGVFHIGYYDICKNYYCNKQEDEAWVIGRMTTSYKTANIIDKNGNSITNTTEQTVPGDITGGYLGKTTNVNKTVQAVQTSNVFKIGSNTSSPVSVTMVGEGKMVKRNVVVGSNTIEVGFSYHITSDGQIEIYIVRLKGPIALATIFTRGYITWTDNYIGNNNELISFPLENLDKCRTAILKASEIGEYVTITDVSENVNNGINYLPYTLNATYDAVNEELLAKKPQCGLMIRTHLNDLFNNFVQTDWIEQVNQKSSIQIQDGTFTMDSLLVAKRVFNYLNRVMLSGGTMQDWQEVTWGVDAQSFVESPIFVGGTSGDIVFDEVVSTSTSGDEALGTLAGRGNINYGDRRGGNINIKIKEPSMIIAIASIIPYVDYSQGNDWEIAQIKTLEDLHKPEFDGIGFQDLPTEWLAWWDRQLSTNGAKTYSLGKQPAWIQYMTNVNKVFGDFGRKNNAEGMVITRNYQPVDTYVEGTSNIKDATTYIRPSNYNYLFAGSSLDDQPFWMQIHFDILARRKMSAAIMPNL